uniref:Uncharacterized protein n=1 Tax=Candidatus Kentrum eta TaxID=2126337 RepID=A0A450V0T8_9GAMM|nr:MAG: hypothetical protein BECKH772A_GA0070896_101382 [Candidatus Kentron sp. H]
MKRTPMANFKPGHRVRERREPRASSAQSQTVRPIRYRNVGRVIILPVRVRTCVQNYLLELA